MHARHLFLALLARVENDALVAVNTGLLRNMLQNEVKALLAHESAHVANGDMVTLSLVQGVVNTFVIFFSRIIGQAVDSFLSRGEDRGGYGIGYWVATIFAQIVLTALASIVVCWFSRRREFRADQAGAELVSPQAMISALASLKSSYNQPSEMPGEMVAFGISGELKHSMAGLFMSHPPLDKRIEALRQRYA